MSIFKTILFNSEGKISSIYIFHGALSQPKIDTLFSKEKAKYIATNFIEIRYVPIFILPDDSIITIKYKILLSTSSLLPS